MRTSIFSVCLLIFLITLTVLYGYHHIERLRRHLLFKTTSNRFYVNTSTCSVPYVSLFSWELMSIWRTQPDEECTLGEDLVRRVYDSKRKQYILYTNDSVARLLDTSPTINKSTKLIYNCSYRSIMRAGEGPNADKSYNLSADIPFSNGYYVPIDVEGMIVNCTSSSGKLLQEDAFSFVQSKPQSLQLPVHLPLKLPLKSSPKPTPHPPLTLFPSKPTRKLNVIMLGIDSLSRINFRRTMPDMLQYVQRSGWFEMQGYNKMGDNTFPNLLAVLTGYSPETADIEICNTKSVGCLDKLPFIWQLYKKAGYMTAYGEDMGYLNTFIYLLKGFVNQPVDHYLRPFYLAIEKNLPIVKRFYRYNCIGRRFNVDYIYDYCQQCFEHYKNSTNPLFGLFWTSSVTHDIFEAAQTLEPTLLDYMERFEKIGLFEESIVIFFSDHGMRYGPLRALPQGFLEERLPILFIWLPAWFRQQHPEIVKALRANRNRLSSPFDLHMTLQHILQLGEGKTNPLVPPEDCPHCQTHFKPLAENRTCLDAGIPEHYCTCDLYETISSKQAQKLPIAKQIIDQINTHLRTTFKKYDCKRLSLKTIKYAERRVKDKTGSNQIVYRFHIIANPEEAEFSATVRYNKKKKKIENLPIDSISRLDLYNNVSKCIDDKVGKKYCICSK
ncbi:uncharacterized protein LOC115626546 [Scaptodrosophila lebanonensis]|uniref:Uncharacterized protein LOC115626546 n=1 Tax=Drosophila lebanonensis TaxID=7225 RepID=A0A6J2TRP8_DROLE|nr:uncharacterized protein LOC115626546 [Scaptodrosophila lebanonensis]